MELNAPNGKLPVTHPHDFIVFGCSGDFKAVGECVAFDDERVITSSGEFLGHIGKKVLFVVLDAGCFSVHKLLSPDDFTPKCLTN